MAIVAKQNSLPTILAPAGLHPARCVGLIDQGTQEEVYKNEKKLKRKILLQFELPTKLHIFHPEDGEEPFLISKPFTLSLGKQSNLLKFLVDWRGKDFTPEQLNGFDMKDILDAPCQLLIGHVPRKDGSGMRADIKVVQPQEKERPVPARKLDLRFYEVTMGRNDVFLSLPQWIQDKISACQEWKTPAPNETVVEEESDETVPF